MVGVAVLGYGFMGRKHAECYRRNEQCELRAILSRRPRESLSLPGAVELVAPQETERLFRDDIDLIDICLPTFLHAEFTLRALEAGKHVLCEKPIALTAAEASRVLEAAAGAEGHLMVGHVLRFWPEYEHMKAVCDGGSLGSVHSISTYRAQPSPLWSAGGWIVDPRYSGGAVLDLQIHDLDFVSWILGTPRTVASEGTRSANGDWEVVTTTLGFEGGSHAVVQINNRTPASYPFRARASISLSDGLMEYDSWGSQRLRVYSEGGFITTPDLPDDDPYQRQIDYFVDCIESGESPQRVSSSEAAAALDLALRCRDSLGRRGARSPRSGDTKKRRKQS